VHYRETSNALSNEVQDVIDVVVLVGEYNMLEWLWSEYLVWFRWSAPRNFKSI